MSIRAWAISAAIACALTSGCSWSFMTKPPEVVSAPKYPLDCTTSRLAPVLDTICVGYFIFNGVLLATAQDCASAGLGQRCVSGDTKTGGLLLSAGLGLLCGLSASSGYGYAARCEQKKELNALCITGDQAACRRLRPDWVPAAGGAQYQGMPPPPADNSRGCAKDTDCKGDRICVSGACVAPATPVPATKTPACQQDSDCGVGICFDGVCRN